MSETPNNKPDEVKKSPEKKEAYANTVAAIQKLNDIGLEYFKKWRETHKGSKEFRKKMLDQYRSTFTDQYIENATRDMEDQILRLVKKSGEKNYELPQRPHDADDFEYSHMRGRNGVGYQAVSSLLGKKGERVINLLYLIDTYELWKESLRKRKRQKTIKALDKLKSDL